MCIPVRGESVLVTLERPQADFDGDLLRAGEWKGLEEDPNSVLFWARYGNESLAQDLAAYFVSHRNGTEHWCRFRGMRHTSLVVQSSDLEDVSEMMQEITDRRTCSGTYYSDRIASNKDVTRWNDDRRPDQTGRNNFTVPGVMIRSTMNSRTNAKFHTDSTEPVGIVNKHQLPSCSA